MSEPAPTGYQQLTGTVFVSLRTRYSNLGDGLIVHALIKSLLDSNRRVVLQVGGVPDSFVQFVLSGLNGPRVAFAYSGYWRLAIGTGLRYRLRSRARTVGPAEVSPVLFLTPGHQSLNLGIRSALRKASYAGLLMVLRICGFRIGRVGISLGRPTSLRTRVLERLVASNCSLYAVRDAYSLNVAQSLGISAAVLAPDISVLLCAVVTNEARTSDRVGVSIRQLGEKGERLSTAVSLICREVGVSGHELFAISQTGEDLPPTRRFLQRAGLIAAEETELLGSIGTVDQLLRHYRQYRLVVSNRLHVILAALIAGTPSIAVVDSDLNLKVVGALEAIDLGGIVFRGDDARDDSVTSFDVAALLEEAAGAPAVLAGHSVQVRDQIAGFLAAG